MQKCKYLKTQRPRKQNPIIQDLLTTPMELTYELLHAFNISIHGFAIDHVVRKRTGSRHSAIIGSRRATLIGSCRARTYWIKSCDAHSITSCRNVLANWITSCKKSIFGARFHTRESSLKVSVPWSTKENYKLRPSTREVMQI